MSDHLPDPRIVHVASELSVPLGPEAENDGNMEYITDVIDAVDYANEQSGKTYEHGVIAGKAVQVNWPQAYEDAVEDCISALEFMDKHPHGLIDAAAAIACLRTIIDPTRGDN